MTPTQADLESALTGLRTALEAGGYELNIDGVQPDGAIQLAVVAGADACAECVMPDDVLAQIASRALADGGMTVESVRLRKVGSVTEGVGE
jgi:hypothetical protein